MAQIPQSSPWVLIVTAIVSAGGIKYVYDLTRQWMSKVPAGLITDTLAAASIATVARARDELEEDNLRIRATLAEERQNWAQERSRMLAEQAIDRERYQREQSLWEQDRMRFRAEIAALEQQIVKERVEAAARSDALLKQVQHLRQRMDRKETS